MVATIDGGGKTTPRIFIIEGPDGAGKTTLARSLCYDYNLEYFHEGPPPIDVYPVMEYYSSLIVNAAMGTVGAVFDRLALGEMVYGPVLRDGDRLGEHGWEDICHVMATFRVEHIVCLPSLETCYGNWLEGRAKNQELIDSSTIFFKTYSKFAYLVNLYGLLTYDYERQTYEDISEIIGRTL